MPSKKQQPAETQEAQAPSNPIIFVWCVIVLYLVFAAAFNHLIPFRTGAHATSLIQANQLATNADETAHFSNVLAYKSGHLPVFAAGNPDYEAHQPPLYYAIMALFVSSSSDEPADLARWVGIAIGALFILVTYFGVRQIFPDRPDLAQGTAAFVALLPMNVNISASISNDVLTNLTVALVILQTARIVRLLPEIPSGKLATQSVLLGIALTLAVYSKMSTLVVMFAFVVIVALLGLKSKLFDTSRFLIFVGISCMLGLALVAPWLVRNNSLYGDPFAQHIFKDVFTKTTMTAEHMTVMQHGVVGYWLYDAKLTLESFWGRFDSMLLGFWPPLYVPLYLISIAAFVGLVMKWRHLVDDLQKAAIVGGLVSLTVLTVAQFVFFNLTFFQAQGRYLYLALIPIGLGFVAGLSALAQRNSDKQPRVIWGTTPAVLAITVGMAILNIYCVELINGLFPPVQ